MMIKVFETNNNGKIKFTREDLEKLLNEVYNDGYREGKDSHNWTWTSPYYASTRCPGDAATITANAFVFLASEEASYITGVVLSVDGMART